jgi:hypothetical protein
MKKQTAQLRKLLGSSTMFLVRAGRRMYVFLGLNPQAESYCPFGAETECLAILFIVALMG